MNISGLIPIPAFKMVVGVMIKFDLLMSRTRSESLLAVYMDLV